MEISGKIYRATNRFLFCAGLLAFCAAPAVRAAVLLNENFDELTQQLTVTSAGAFSTINGTNVDVVGNPGSFPLCNGPESGNCIDMNGSSGNPQGQLQSNMLFAAGSYLLSFDLIGDQRGSTASVTVTFGSYDQMFTLTSADLAGGIVVNAPVTVTTPTHLLFASDVPGVIGLELDNVVVSTSATTIPEPASLLLMGSALLAGAMALRRRTQHPR